MASGLATDVDGVVGCERDAERADGRFDGALSGEATPLVTTRVLSWLLLLLVVVVVVLLWWWSSSWSSWWLLLLWWSSLFGPLGHVTGTGA